MLGEREMSLVGPSNQSLGWCCKADWANHLSSALAIVCEGRVRSPPLEGARYQVA